MATPPHHCKEIKLHRGQLDLDSPLLSTRRSSTSIDAESSLRELSAQTTMIPFSWESSPGVPKDAAAANATDRTSPPPPNPPPARWRPSSEIHCTTNNHDRCNARDDDDDDDVFSDAAEKISLSENLNIACRLSSFDGMASKDVEEMVNRSRPRPSYIMERFLPAANAIANSLALNQHNKGCSTRRADHHHSSCTQCARKELTLQHIMHQRRKRRSSTAESKPQQPPFFSHLEEENELSTRACGVMLFFPWSLRPIVCGFKSPPRSTTPNGSNNIINSLFTPRSMRGVSNELHLDNDEGTNSGSFDIEKKPSVRECYSPGWGLSFFDRRRKALRCVLEREREKGCEKSKKDRKDVSKCKEGNWRMPQLKTHSEPWLSHALNSINKRN